jgi:hypothetical protein
VRAQVLVMDYVEMLERLHAAIQPEVYLEIGVDYGRSLVVSRSRTVAIDPHARLSPAVFFNKPWVKVFRMASDDFFQSEMPAATLEGHRLDLAFIDGLHEFTQVVRDLENVERWAHSGTIVVIDDVLPRNTHEASLAWHEGAWTGDVWRVVPFLREHRPDLRCSLVNVWEAGALIVSELNPDHPGMADQALALNRDFAGDGPEYERMVNAWIADSRPVSAELALGALFPTPDAIEPQPERNTPTGKSEPTGTSTHGAPAPPVPAAPRARRRKKRVRR